MIIPPQNMEIESVYTDIWRQNYRSIAITSTNPHEGVSTLAAALTQRNLLAGHSTLLVDLNVNKPSLKAILSLPQCDKPKHIFKAPELVHEVGEEITFTGVTAPIDRSAIMQLRSPGVLKSQVQIWLNQFDTVIVDTSSVYHSHSDGIPAELVASVCDATLLVVLAGSTRELMVANAVQRLNRNAANIMGCVINDQINPTLKSELLRETQRLQKYSTGLTRLISALINTCAFLNIEHS